jgi:hypothetical protein
MTLVRLVCREHDMDEMRPGNCGVMTWQAMLSPVATHGHNC